MVATQLNFRLDGRVAVITGASSGIGAAIATALASAGASVIAVGREQTRLAELIQDIRSKGHTAESVVAELTTPDGVHGVVEAAVEGHLVFGAVTEIAFRFDHAFTRLRGACLRRK